MAAWQLPPAAAARVKDRIKDPAMAAMARIPLLLALLCSLAAQQPAGEGLPRTRGQLYERVLRWFLTRAHRSQDDPDAQALDEVEIEALLEILAPLAYTFATQPAGWTDLMPGDRLLQAIRTAGPPFTELHRSAAEVLRELSVGAGVLVPEGDPSAGQSVHYLFLHRTVAEYLTARRLATLPEADWQAMVDQHLWFDPDWAEVIPMLGERLSPQAARALIQHLLANVCDPFHQSLFTAARIWGARADADRLLAPQQENELAGQLDDLLRHWLTCDVAASHCADMTYLPRRLLTHLLEDLTDQDEDVRVAAVGALTGRDDASVVEALLERLTDQDEDVRVAAVRALAGQDHPGVTEALLGLLTDTSQPVRVAAVRGLTSRNDPAAAEALLEHLADRERPIWAAAAQALAGRDDPGLTDALLGRLANQNPSVRVAAVRALAGHDDPGVAEALLGRLTDQDSSVRAAAAKALAGRDDPGLVEALLDCLADQDYSTRVRATRALAGRDDLGLADALLGRLYDQNPSVRVAATGALAGRDDLAVTEALLGRLTDIDRVRVAATRALAGRDGPRVTEALLGLLTDTSRPVRAAATRALAGRDDPRVTEALLGLLTDTSRPVRAAATRALAGRDDLRVTEALLARLNEPDRHMRVEAIKALADRGEPTVVQVLVDRLASQHSSERRAVVRALAGRADRGVTEALLACLTEAGDDSFMLQAAAAEALAAQESPQALLSLAKEVRRLSWSALPHVVWAAERLMIRYYRYLEPAERPGVLAAMGWLTAAVLTDTEGDPPL